MATVVKQFSREILARFSHSVQMATMSRSFQKGHCKQTGLLTWRRTVWGYWQLPRHPKPSISERGRLFSNSENSLQNDQLSIYSCILCSFEQWQCHLRQREWELWRHCWYREAQRLLLFRCLGSWRKENCARKISRKGNLDPLSPMIFFMFIWMPCAVHFK